MNWAKMVRGVKPWDTFRIMPSGYIVQDAGLCLEFFQNDGTYLPPGSITEEKLNELVDEAIMVFEKGSGGRENVKIFAIAGQITDEARDMSYLSQRQSEEVQRCIRRIRELCDKAEKLEGEKE